MIVADLPNLHDSVVVYEADFVSRADVELAHAWGRQTRLTHLAADDADIASDAGIDTETFPSTRSEQFRQIGVDRLDRFREHLARTAGPIMWRGIDLAGVSLFDWQHRAADALLKEWLFERFVESGTVTRVLWIAAPRPHHASFAADAGRFLRAAGIDFSQAPSAPPLSGLRLGVLRMKNDAAASRVWRAGRASAGRQSSTESKTRPRVLFVESYPKTAKVAGAAARVLEGGGAADVWFVVTRRDAFDAVAPMGLRRLVLLDALASREAWHQSRTGQRHAVRAAYASVGSAPGMLGREFALATAWQWRQAAHFVSLLDDVIARIGPDAVASTSQFNVFARAAAAVARKAGATSYFLQHGLLSHDAIESRVTADRQLLWSDWDRRQRLALGAPEASLEVTGSPTLQDEMLRFEAVRSPWRAETRLKVLFLPSLTSGMWMSQANGARQRDTVLRAIDGLPDAELVIKLHPSDRAGLFSGTRTAVLQQGTAGPLIAQADVVITSTSTAGLEAAALDKPVVILRTPGVRVFRQYEHEAFLFAADARELRAHLERLHADPALRASLAGRRASFAADVFDGLRPGAAARMAHAIARGATERFERAHAG